MMCRWTRQVRIWKMERIADIGGLTKCSAPHNI
jgi:hypothetical protein